MLFRRAAKCCRSRIREVLTTLQKNQMQALIQSCSDITGMESGVVEESLEIGGYSWRIRKDLGRTSCECEKSIWKAGQIEEGHVLELMNSSTR